MVIRDLIRSRSQRQILTKKPASLTSSSSSTGTWPRMLSSWLIPLLPQCHRPLKVLPNPAAPAVPVERCRIPFLYKGFQGAAAAAFTVSGTPFLITTSPTISLCSTSLWLSESLEAVIQQLAGLLTPLGIAGCPHNDRYQPQIAALRSRHQTIARAVGVACFEAVEPRILPKHLVGIV